MSVLKFSEKNNVKSVKNGNTVSPEPEQPSKPVEKSQEQSPESGSLPNQPEESITSQKQSSPEAAEGKTDIPQTEIINGRNESVPIKVRRKWLASRKCTLTN